MNFNSDSKEYRESIQAFIDLIQSHQGDSADWFVHAGRKFDKIARMTGILDEQNEVRYFVERSTGNIYGARSNTTPNLSWYFGNLNRCHLWDWTGFHGVPTSDPGIRAVSHYGPYIRYIEE